MAEEQKPTEDKIECSWTRRETCISTGSLFLVGCIFTQNTVDENIIATINLRNNFCYHLKMVSFSIMR